MSCPEEPLGIVFARRSIGSVREANHARGRREEVDRFCEVLRAVLPVRAVIELASVTARTFERVAPVFVTVSAARRTVGRW